MTSRHSFPILTAVVLLIGSPASADDTEPLSGFVTRGDGDLIGQVSHGDDKPLARVEVHIVSSTGVHHIVTTDSRGRYRVALAAGTWAVSVKAEARITGTLVTASNEVVEVYDTIPPRTMAKPLSNPATVPEYSEASIERNEWTRAWLLLDIDATGTVTRLKMLRAPGQDLDSIAIREGLALRFEPARDIADRPTRSLLIWSFEWPAYWWMVAHKRRSMRRLPAEVAAIPCRGSGPTRSVYRDCSRPDPQRIVSGAWISRARK